MERFTNSKKHQFIKIFIPPFSLNPMKLSEAIDKRTSVRRFSKKKVRWDYVLEAIDAAIKAPFAGNVNNLIFIIVEDPTLINKLTECCQQDWVADASYVVVVCSDPHKLEMMYQDKGKDYGKQQIGAAIENFLLKITDLKLASCWIGAYTEDYIKKELEIPENIDIEALLPVGYAYKGTGAKKTKPKKASLEKIIRWNSWKTQKKPIGLKDPRTW
jgi:nitroreductase